MLVTVTLLATATVLTLGFRYLSVRRSEAEALAGIQSRNLALAVDDSITGSFQRIDQALGTIAGELAGDLREGRLDRPGLQRLLRLEGTLIPGPGLIWITDDQGHCFLGSASVTTVPPWGGRWWFQYCKAHPDAAMVVAKPIIGFLTKKWVIPCVRPYVRPNGDFAGVAVIPLAVDYLHGLIAGFDLGPGGTLTLRDGDGGFITRYPKLSPGHDLAMGDPSGSAELLAFIKSGRMDETHFAVSPVDRAARIYANRRLKIAPLLVGAGLAQADYLGQWRRDRNRAWALMGFALAGIWTMAWFFRRLWRAQVRNAKALELSEHRFRYVSSSMLDLAYSGHLEGGEVLVIDWMIGAAPALLGFAIEEIMAGRDWGNLVVPEDRPKFLKHILGLAPGEDASCELRLMKKDGGVTWFESFAQCEVPADGEGGPRIYGALVNITERKLNEAMQRKLEAELNQMQKLDSLGKLAGGVAHDMNNVLAAIQAVTETLQEQRAQDTELAKALGIIGTASLRGRDLVKGLTNFARKEIREAELLDLNALVREEMEILRRTTKQMVALDLALEEPLPAILGERGTLGSALMNLCVNALDAMPQGGSLTLRTRTLPEGMVGLEVADSGTGMPPEVLARALEPFFTTKAIGKGTGLGLSSVYATAKAHGGGVAIESEPGAGTTVRLLLPAVLRPAAPEAAPAPSAVKVGPLSLLLVDDDPLIRASVPPMLASFGHRVSTVSGGEQALKFLETGVKVDMVILDLNMPGLNGLETLHGIRRLGLDLPVVLASGHLDGETQERLEADPRVVALGKPFTMEELGGKILALLSQRD